MLLARVAIEEDKLHQDKVRLNLGPSNSRLLIRSPIVCILFMTLSVVFSESMIVANGPVLGLVTITKIIPLAFS